MATQAHAVPLVVTPRRFLSEVQEFRAVAADPALTTDEKKRAYGVIVQHACLLDPREIGYEGAGIALKEALSSWLDCKSTDH